MKILGQIYEIELNKRSYSFDRAEYEASGPQVVSVFLDTFYTIEDNQISSKQARRIAHIYHHILSHRYFGFGRHQRKFDTAETLIKAMCSDLRPKEIKRLKELNWWGFSNKKG